VVDEIARLWVRRVAEEMGVTDRVALADAPPDFGRRIAANEAGHQAISVLGPTGRGLAHLDCL
jgi:hypothetical protein